MTWIYPTTCERNLIRNETNPIAELSSGDELNDHHRRVILAGHVFNVRQWRRKSWIPLDSPVSRMLTHGCSE